MKLVALCGAAGAGKDTTADLLPARKLAFADALYQEVAQAWGVSVDQLKHREAKEVKVSRYALAKCQDQGFLTFFRKKSIGAPHSPREILQWWGDYKRAYDADYFVKKAEAAMLQASRNGADVVFTDARFANEVAMVRSCGGQLWQIQRPDVQAGGTGHESDNDGSQFGPERIIPNDGDIERLRLVALAVWEEV